MKSAEKMFEEIGCKITNYNNCIIEYKKEYKLKGSKHIIFSLLDKTICVCGENKDKIAVNRDYFTLKELKAINKQCQELGWL